MPSWRRVAVAGHSMEPTLRDGDWLLIDTAAKPSVGDLVVARHPRAAARLIVKRVTAVEADGLRVAGDHPAHSVEEEIGPIGTNLVVGRPWLRYWPLRRFGRVA